jgi:hypothetical protein
MKTMILQVLLILASATVIAQETATVGSKEYIPLPETNAIWTELNGIYEGFPPQSWTNLFSVETDTMLLGKNYKNVYEHHLSLSTFDTIRELYASIRQDTIAEKVYIIRHYLSENIERLLIDFNVSVGDTVILDAYYWDIDPLTTDSLFIVDSISAITLSNQTRRIQYLSNHKTFFPVSQIIIEGVGSIFNPFGPTTKLVNKNYSKRELCCPMFLLCLTVDGDNVYVYNDESECLTLQILNSTKPTIQQASVSLYPNPTDGYCRIKINSECTLEKLFEIYDFLGRKVLHQKFYQNDITIDLGKLKPGTYIIQIWCDYIPITNKLIITP